MFSNIGVKIKTLAVVVTVLGILGSVAAGITMMDYEEEAGLIIMITGSLISWIMSFYIYGYGEIICQLKRSNELQEAILRKLNNPATPSAPATEYSAPTYTPAQEPAAYAQPNTFSGWQCKCGTQNTNNSNFCVSCGTPKNN